MSSTIADDGSFEWRFGPELGLKKGSTLIIREVYDDWNAEERGQIRIQRLDTAGQPRGPLTPERVAKRYGVAAKMLVGRINTWFAFPEWFTYKEPVNTLTVPKSTPGGLASQFSSIGHYSLGDDEAMIVTVPVSECAYQAIQIGSRWYISTDYEHHQTSLTKAQSHADPDGRFRYVVSERNPGIANWLETCGHPQGVMMLRWQRLSRALDAADGPTVEVVPFDSLASRLPHFAEQPDHRRRVHRPHRRPPGRHRPEDDLVTPPSGRFWSARVRREGTHGWPMHAERALSVGREGSSGHIRLAGTNRHTARSASYDQPLLPGRRASGNHYCPVGELEGT